VKEKVKQKNDKGILRKMIMISREGYPKSGNRILPGDFL